MIDTGNFGNALLQPLCIYIYINVQIQNCFLLFTELLSSLVLSEEKIILMFSDPCPLVLCYRQFHSVLCLCH